MFILCNKHTLLVSDADDGDKKVVHVWNQVVMGNFCAFLSILL